MHELQITFAEMPLEHMIEADMSMCKERSTRLICALNKSYHSQGMEVSQKAITTYCSVHRLLLALADRYNLWDEASKRLDAFLLSESNRNKAGFLLLQIHL